MKVDGLLDRFKKVFFTIARYRYPIFGLLIVSLFAFTVWRIDYLSAPERDEEAYSQQLGTVERVDFDDQAIEQILDLRDAGVNVRPRFPGNRTNPF